MKTQGRLTACNNSFYQCLLCSFYIYFKVYVLSPTFEVANATWSVSVSEPIKNDMDMHTKDNSNTQRIAILFRVRLKRSEISTIFVW